MTEHGWTRHGHSCCDQATGPRPLAVARCGGPGLCKECSADMAIRHSPRSGTVPDTAGPLFDQAGHIRELEAEIARLHEHEKIRAQTIAEHQARLIAADAAIAELAQLRAKLAPRCPAVWCAYCCRDAQWVKALLPARAICPQCGRTDTPPLFQCVMTQDHPAFPGRRRWFGLRPGKPLAAHNFGGLGPFTPQGHAPNPTT